MDTLKAMDRQERDAHDYLLSWCRSYLAKRSDGAPCMRVLSPVGVPEYGGTHAILDMSRTEPRRNPRDVERRDRLVAVGNSWLEVLASHQGV